MVGPIARTSSTIPTRRQPSRPSTATIYAVPPKDFKEFLDIAKFFYRPDANPPIYGVAVYTQKDYDAITMGFQNALFTYGGDWQDANRKVKGVVNSQECVEALEFYKALYDCGPPGNTNAFYTEMNNCFIGGQAAMAMNYFAFLPALSNQGTNPNYYDKVGFFSNPTGPYGAAVRLAGWPGHQHQLLHQRRAQAGLLDFLKWFARTTSR